MLQGLLSTPNMLTEPGECAASGADAPGSQA
jgi:hypothetical protein